MARPVKWPPSILNHKPSGRCRIRVAGKDYWLGPIGSDEARQEYARLVGELAAGGVPARGDTRTVAEVVSAWWEDQAPSVSEKAKAQYRTLLSLLVRLYGDTPADDFDALALGNCRDAMTSGSWLTPAEKAARLARGKNPDWCAAHASRQVVRIRTVWRWAETQKLVAKGSWGNLRTLRSISGSDRRVRHKARLRPASWEDLQLVLTRLRSAALKAMLLLQWTTGMRSCEIRIMRPCDIDMSGPVWKYTPRTHKNAWRGQSRVVPLGPETQKILGPWLLGANPQREVFRTRTGKRYSSDTYSSLPCRAAKKVGLDWFRPYCLRHSAKQRLTREHGLDVARAVLGQKTLTTTDGYGDATDWQLAEKAAARSC
jgi:integrase